MPDITIKATNGGSFAAYLAEPAGGKGSGIVLIQEIFGVNKVMRDLADSYAKQGYTVLCPDLFWRQQPGIQITDKTEAEWARAFELFKGFNRDNGIDDLVATLDHLRTQLGAGKAGCVGYCLGGQLAYLMAARSNVDCAAGYYGVGLDGLLDEVSKINKPLLMHIADADSYTPPPAQKKIKDAFAKNPNITVETYPGQEHAFARVGGQHYNKDAADRANKRTAEFFKKHLG